MKRLLLSLPLAVLLVAACTAARTSRVPQEEYASWFKVLDSAVVSISPFGGSDTLRIGKPLSSIICMSGSYIGYLDAIGCDSVISAVSGIQYVTCPAVRRRFDEGLLFDIGYDSAPDYERIVDLHPDLLLTYSVSSSKSPFLQRLESLGVRTMVLWEHLESDPLARAEYVKLFGALTDRRSEASEFFATVRDNYNKLKIKTEAPKKVLVNMPYAGLWYIPGADNYLSRIISDAGGEVLGAKKGAIESGTISLEEAYALSKQADIWLHPGSCRSREEIRSAGPALAAIDIPLIFNNIRRSTPGGGNDFWESAPVRPDLVLADLRAIFSEAAPADSLTYYLPVL